MNDSHDFPNQSEISDGLRLDGPEHDAIQDRIRRLIETQPYAVLCTQGQSQPYGSLVAFAASENLKHIVFSTPIASRKYRLLSECEHVALVVDSRSVSPDDLMQIEAVTATGRARIVEPGPDFDHWARLLINRHPHLAEFVHAESCALVCINVVQYFHVGRFQEVRQWEPSKVVNPSDQA
jgi:nitroimidazol reductase NimA-like FMN-containing flavoprotein (pyridoxamine 5'-phosphate oxidase superfamily)